MHTAEKGDDRYLRRAIAKWAGQRFGGPGKSPEQEPKPQTKPQPQVSASAQSQRIWRGIAIIPLVLSLGAPFAISQRNLPWRANNRTFSSR
jgi:hypothetical protein